MRDDIEKVTPLDDHHHHYRNEPRQVVAAGPDPAVYPDGGFDAWIAVAGGFCTIFASFGWINCKPVVLNSPDEGFKSYLTTDLLV